MSWPTVIIASAVVIALILIVNSQHAVEGTISLGDPTVTPSNTNTSGQGTP